MNQTNQFFEIVVLQEQWLPFVTILSEVTLYLLVATNFVLFFYILFVQDPPMPALIFVMVFWPDNLKNKVAKVYMYFAASVLILVSAFLLFQFTKVEAIIKEHMSINSYVTPIGLFFSMNCLYKFSYYDQYYPKLTFFVMHSILQAEALCGIEKETFVECIITLTLLVIILTIISFTADKGLYSMLLLPLSRLNGIVLSASICLSVIKLPRNHFEVGLLCVNLHLGLVFFSFLFIANTQIIIADCYYHTNKFDPVYYAMVLEISAFNIFLRIASSTTLHISAQPCDYFVVL